MSEIYAVVDNETKFIINTIMWDGLSLWTPPENTTVKLWSSLTEEEIIFPPREEE